MTAPETDVSASRASGEYRQAPSGFFLAEVTAQRTASSSACPIERPAPVPRGEPTSSQSFRSSTVPYASARASMAKPC